MRAGGGTLRGMFPVGKKALGCGVEGQRLLVISDLCSSLHYVKVSRMAASWPFMPSTPVLSSHQEPLGRPTS